MFQRILKPSSFLLKRSSILFSTGILSFGFYHVGKSYQLESPMTSTSLPVNPYNLSEMKEYLTGVIYKKCISLSYPDQEDETKEKNHLLSLIGLGVRQVTLLYIPVYTMGLYIDETTKSRILSSSMWKQEYSSVKLVKGHPQSKWFLSNLLEKGNGLCLVLENVRRVDGPHLRTGFIRFLMNRLYENKEIFDKEEFDQIYSDLDEFKSRFPTGYIESGNRIYFTRLPNGYLRVEFPDSQLSEKSWEVKNEKIANWFFEGYLNPTSPISPPLYESVSIGLQDVLCTSFPFK